MTTSPSRCQAILRLLPTDYLKRCGIGLLFAFTVAFLGAASGWFSGASRTAISATVVPLLFGFMPLVLFQKQSVSAGHLLAVLIFVVAFFWGVRQGQRVERPLTALEALEQSNTDVADCIFQELALLDVQMMASGISGHRHNGILCRVGITLARSGMPNDEIVQAIREYREALRIAATGVRKIQDPALD